MGSETKNKVTREFEIKNQEGIHARPSAIISKAANKYSSDICLIKEGQKVNCKDILDIMLLALTYNSKVTLEIIGEDAEIALEEIGKLLETEFNFMK